MFFRGLDEKLRMSSINSNCSWENVRFPFNICSNTNQAITFLSEKPVSKLNIKRPSHTKIFDNELKLKSASVSAK
jgi:hypothetical protein